MITQFSQIPQGFFGENGLTATHATHIADLCKQRYQRLENDLASLNYITEKMSIVGSNAENINKTPIIMSDEEIIEKNQQNRPIQRALSHSSERRSNAKTCWLTK